MLYMYMYVPGTAITISLSLQYGRSSLMLVSGNGHVAVVEMLLSKGAHVDLQDKVSMGGMERGWGDHMGGMERASFGRDGEGIIWERRYDNFMEISKFVCYQLMLFGKQKVIFKYMYMYVPEDFNMK